MPDFSAYYQIASKPETVGLATVAALILIGGILFKKLRPWQSYLQSKPILTPNEREFFHRLTRALPTYPIFPQVSLSALIAVDSQLSTNKQFSIRRRFGWKYADFVICAPYTLDPLVIVELDDSTHVASTDRQRDSMTKAAGYQTLRFQSKHKPTVAELADVFGKLLPTLQPSKDDSKCR